MKGNVDHQQLEEVRKKYGIWLRKQRVNLGLTQQDLADRMEISRSTISKIEDGKWNFGIDTITLFAKHLNFTWPPEE